MFEEIKSLAQVTRLVSGRARCLTYTSLHVYRKRRGAVRTTCLSVSFSKSETEDPKDYGRTAFALSLQKYITAFNTWTPQSFAPMTNGPGSPLTYYSLSCRLFTHSHPTGPVYLGLPFLQSPLGTCDLYPTPALSKLKPQNSNFQLAVP